MTLIAPSLCHHCGPRQAHHRAMAQGQQLAVGAPEWHPLSVALPVAGETLSRKCHPNVTVVPSHAKHSENNTAKPKLKHTSPLTTPHTYHHIHLSPHPPISTSTHHHIHLSPHPWPYPHSHLSFCPKPPAHWKK